MIAGLKAGAKVALKAGGRFVPGVNIAIAAADGIKAGASVAKAINDPSPENIRNAAFDGVTAVGSALARTLTEHPRLCLLTTVLATVLEQNVSLETVVTFKQQALALRVFMEGRESTD